MNADKALYIDSLDGLDALLEIERVFDVSIPDEIAAEMHNVGNLYDYLQKRQPPISGEKCITSMAFYRLRRSLTSGRHRKDVTPKTNLEDLFTQKPKNFWRKLEEDSGLSLPQLNNTIIGNTCITVLFFSIFGLFLSGFLMPKPFVLGILIFIIILAFVIIKFDPMKLPKSLVNMDDLAKATSRENFGKFERQGARTNDSIRWSILVDILSSWSDPLMMK